MKGTTRFLLISALGSLAACANLDIPDQRLAQEALQRGDTATAERHFRQLAALGYTDAQIGLADLQVASHDPVQLRQAEQTYRLALDASPRAKARLGKLLAAKPDASEAEKREAERLLGEAFAAGEPTVLLPLAMLYIQYPQSFPDVSLQQRINQWRAAGHAQAGLAQIVLYRTQGSYDQHLDEVEQICKGLLSQYDVCYAELATVYQKRQQTAQQQALLKQLLAAQRSGAVPASRVESVAAVLADPQLGPTDEKTAQSLLTDIAPTYPAAWISLAQLLYDFPALGEVDQLLDYVERGREADPPRAHLLLGKFYYEGKLAPQNPAKAEEHLLQASDASTSAHYYLGQIYRRGYLGQVYPQKALDHLLIAARAGQPNADYGIAQLFAQGRGVKPNLANAYVFIRLAQLQGRPGTEALMQDIETRISPAERIQAERLMREEQQARSGAWQAGLQMQAVQLSK